MILLLLITVFDVPYIKFQLKLNLKYIYINLQISAYIYIHLHTFAYIKNVYLTQSGARKQKNAMFSSASIKILPIAY